MPINADRLLITPPLDPSLAVGAGGADAWYGVAAGAVQRLLSEAGLRFEEIARPEQFKSPAFGRLRGLADGAYVHLIFRSADSIRAIPGCYNIAWFGWGLEVLKKETRAQESVLESQVRMLSLCDEVWVPSAFARTILAEHGVRACHLVPAPVFGLEGEAPDTSQAMQRLAFMESVELLSYSAGGEQDYREVVENRRRPLDRQDQVTRAVERGRGLFLTVCDPSDPAKNFASMVEGFLMAAQGRRGAALIVVVQGDRRSEARQLLTPDADPWLSLAESLFEQVRGAFGHPHALVEDRIVLVSEASLGRAISDLYAVADFYLCGSIAEVQNLPMLEAMAHGCVPVTIANTAMREFVDDENGVVIQSGRYRGLVNGLAADGVDAPYVVDYADRYQIADGVGAALALSGAAYAAKQESARTTVRRDYAADAVLDRILRRLAVIDPALSRESLSGASDGDGGSSGRRARVLEAASAV